MTLLHYAVPFEEEWATEASTSMGWTEHTLDYFAEINSTTNEFGTGILCALRFKMVW